MDAWLGMETTTWLPLAALVFLSGLVDAVAGGGGLISLPAYFAAGLPAHAALATNKFSACLGTGGAVWTYLRSGRFTATWGLVAALGALIGAALGTRVALLTAPETIRTLLLVLVPLVLLFFLFKDRWLKRRSSSAEMSPRRLAFGASLIGLAIGFYDGFFGPGTGTFMTLAFNAALGLDLLEASASARIANLASNAASLAVFLWAGQVLFPLALLMAVLGVAGGMAGARLALWRGAKLIRPVMIGVMLLLLVQVARQGW